MRRCFDILTINPGSTSVKLSLFRNLTEIKSVEISCSSKLDSVDRQSQINVYRAEIYDFLQKEQISSISAVVGRGGFIDRSQQDVRSGVYEVAKLVDGKLVVNNDLVNSVLLTPELDHASNYGIPLAAAVAELYNVPAFSVDPVVASDFSKNARFSGHKDIERLSIAHILSVREIGRRSAAKINKSFQDCNIVAIHLGGGITVAALECGKVVDNNLALLGEGSFSPQRTGGLPVYGVLDLSYSGKYSKSELKQELAKHGGLMSYLGTDDLAEIYDRIDAGDSYAEDVVNAMAYQIAKDVGAMAIVCHGGVDAIAISGGIARSERFIELLQYWIGHIAEIHVFPGSVEMEAMASGALQVLEEKEIPIVFKSHIG